MSETEHSETEHSNDPLHGITLKALLTTLVERYEWAGLAQKIDVACFRNDPSIKSSLKFLRKTPWARAKVEALWISDARKAERNRQRNKRRAGRRAIAATYAEAEAEASDQGEGHQIEGEQAEGEQAEAEQAEAEQAEAVSPSASGVADASKSEPPPHS